MKRVLLYGTFDVMHEGHLDFMRQAKEHGDHLIAVVARDVNVERIKGKRPLHDEMKRKRDVEETGLADEVRLGSLGNPYDAIVDIRPDVICLGYDQVAYTESLAEELVSRGMSPKIVRLNAYKPHKYKSSILKREMGL